MNDLFIQSLEINWNAVEKNSYLRGIKAINDLESLDFSEAVTFFVGENGSGKSTLLRAMAVLYGFNPEGGTRNYNFSTYDMRSELCGAMRLSKSCRRAEWGYYFNAESFFNVATWEEEYSKSEYTSEHYHQKSHGESFLALAQKQFGANGLYILDEPEAALSPQRQLTLLAEIYDCVKTGSQFIIATHSPILLGLPEAEILSFDDGVVHPCDYEDTESYRITKLFINNKDRLLGELLKN